MKKLFLDLEGTIIDDIDNCGILEDNAVRIHALISRESPDKISTFSWAFWSQADLAKFPGIAKWFKSNFGWDIKLQSFDVRQQRLEFLNSVLGHVRPGEEFDFGELANKERVFEWFARRLRLEGHFILVDDTVPTKTILCNNGQLRIDMLNVRGLR